MKDAWVLSAGANVLQGCFINFEGHPHIHRQSKVENDDTTPYLGNPCGYGHVATAWIAERSTAVGAARRPGPGG